MSDNSTSSNPWEDFQQIDESDDIFRQIFKYSIIPTIVHDMDMNIINVNDTAVEEFGYPREEFLNKSIFDLHTEDEIEHSKIVLEEMKQQKKLGIETRFKRKDGSVFMAEATPCKYIIGNKPMIHVFIQDITERKQTEQKLKEFNTELEIKVANRTKDIKNKNKQLEQFAFIASHDLQEPLRTISNYIQIINEDYGNTLDEEVKKYLKTISKSTDRMRALISALLNFSRLGQNRTLNTVNSKSLATEVIDDLHQLIQQKKATVEIGDLPQLLAFETELRQIFQNLIVNALKFQKENRPPAIQVGYTELKDHHQFSITDNGIGIDPKNKDHIFQVFRKLHSNKEYEGFGIGLSYCKKITEIHDGKIWVESEKGKGSTFYFTISKQLKPWKSN